MSPLYPVNEPFFWTSLVALVAACIGAHLAYRFSLRVPRAGAEWFVAALWVGVVLRAFFLVTWLVEVCPSKVVAVANIGPVLVYVTLAVGLYRFCCGAECILRERDLYED